MGRETICHMSDLNSTAYALGGKFDKEDCGFFEECTHRVEKYDMTVQGGSAAEIWYCVIDWRKVGPLIILGILLIIYIARKIRKKSSSDDIKSHSSSKHH